mmetsp:Transcript_26269/g.57552  ORF Transcript_26269/g.57552 Transcript_26269/m.57552 type:complete len:290 (+) Transcript_26269:321-1190(+)|eukprot:CAMPEP_0168186848 /NCGR_PEP_ID=MMETSP0139_2-20121125/14673_1 /TAXON_ID=44445 /ORGANISM="Pseudo-nitzschia australis, Strain 10249 10 AB" /LENGTH=289 /DNA_ID=CAMNT_0008108927 /DNA_START=263 /DNA_END=1132 /DNA_ORIENTATION=-
MTTKKNSNNSNKNKNSNSRPFRTIHTNYKPFLNYIKHHSGIDDATVERAEKRFGGIDINNLNELYANPNNKNTNTKTNTNTNIKNNMPTAATAATAKMVNTKDSFRDQAEIIAQKQQQKEEKDAERHSDLHSNYKPGSYTDEDKIFLLKREIDQLKDQLKSNRNGKGQQLGKQSSITSSSSNSGVGVGNSSTITTSTLLLVAVCLLLVTARTLKKRMARIRSSNALLPSSSSSSSNSTRAGSTVGVVELQNCQSSSSQSSFGWVPPSSVTQDNDNDNGYGEDSSEVAFL